MKLTLLKTIPSGSHNAPYSEELGAHWPAGQEFKLLPKNSYECKYYRPEGTTVLEQIGGEEVLLLVPNSKFVELFGIESPYAAEDARTTKFFNDRHDARVAAGNQSLFED